MPATPPDINIFNYPIKTEEAKRFWASNHKCNIAKAFVAFCLDEEDYRDRAKRHHYSREWRDRVWDAFGMYVNTPDMVGIPFSELDTPYWECLPGLNNGDPINSQPYVIGMTPSNTYIPEGTSFTIEVVATGSPTITYQWYKNNVLISGATNSSYTINPFEETDDGIYHCILTNPFGVVVTPKHEFAASIAAPTITLQPVDQDITTDDVAIFTAEATDYDSVQWYRNGVIMDGETSTTLNVQGTLGQNNSTYSAAFINSQHTVFTNSARLTVTQIIPVITLQPVNVVSNVGEVITLTADAINYDTAQWFKRNMQTKQFEPIPFATNTTLQDTGVFSGLYDSYYAEFSNHNGTARTEIATVYVHEYLATHKWTPNLDNTNIGSDDRLWTVNFTGDLSTGGLGTYGGLSTPWFPTEVDVNEINIDWNVYGEISNLGYYILDGTGISRVYVLENSNKQSQWNYTALGDAYLDGVLISQGAVEVFRGNHSIKFENNEIPNVEFIGTRFSKQASFPGQISSVGLLDNSPVQDIDSVTFSGDGLQQGTIPDWMVTANHSDTSTGDNYSGYLYFSLENYTSGDTWNILEGNEEAKVTYKDDVISFVSESGTTTQFLVNARTDGRMNKLEWVVDNENITCTFNGIEQVGLLPTNMVTTSSPTISETLGGFGQVEDDILFNTGISNTWIKFTKCIDDFSYASPIHDFTLLKEGVEYVWSMYVIKEDKSAPVLGSSEDIKIVVGNQAVENGVVEAVNSALGLYRVYGSIIQDSTPTSGTSGCFRYPSSDPGNLWVTGHQLEMGSVTDYQETIGDKTLLPYSPFQYDKIGSQVAANAHEGKVSHWGMTDYSPLSGRDVVTFNNLNHVTTPLWDAEKACIKLTLQIHDITYTQFFLYGKDSFRIYITPQGTIVCQKDTGEYVGLSGNETINLGINIIELYRDRTVLNSVEIYHGNDVDFSVDTFGAPLDSNVDFMMGNVELIDNAALQDQWTTKGGNNDLTGILPETEPLDYVAFDLKVDYNGEAQTLLAGDDNLLMLLADGTLYPEDNLLVDGSPYTGESLVDGATYHIEQTSIQTLPYEWTPNFDGVDAHGYLQEIWLPSGNSFEVSISMFVQEPYSLGNIFSQREDYASSNFEIRYLSSSNKSISTELATDDIRWTYYSITTDADKFVETSSKISGRDLEITSNDVTTNHTLPFDFKMPAFPAAIGRRRDIRGEQFRGQIHNIQLLDNYDTGRNPYPVNGRDVVELDGLTQYGEIPALSEIDPANFEIEIDFFLRGFSNDSIMSNGDTGARMGFGVLSEGGFAMYVNNTYKPALMPSSTVNRVYNLRQVFANGLAKLFVDGVELVSTPVTIPPNMDSGVFLGLFNTSLNDFADGYPVNFRVKNLNTSQVARYYPLDRADIIQDVNEPDFPELVVNGDFETDSDWVKGDGWSIIDGNAEHISPAINFSKLSQSIAFSIGKTYELILDVESVSQGQIYVELGDVFSDFFVSSGVYKFTLSPSSLLNPLSIIARFDPVDCKVNSISVRETTQGNWINAPQEVYRPNNSIEIDTIIKSNIMPTESRLYNKLDNNTQVGNLFNLDSENPYVKVIKWDKSG